MISNKKIDSFVNPDKNMHFSYVSNEKSHSNIVN